METFDSEWLRLREPADHTARPPQLAEKLDKWYASRRVAERPLRVLDLGSGAGSNLRYLAPRLTGRQMWTLVDHDATLAAFAEAPRADVAVRNITGDLAREGLDHARDAEIVTASALLDLVSHEWMSALAKQCADVGSAALLALSYDGRVEWHPSPDDPASNEPLDARVLAAVNEHQQQNKGLGMALGPEAAVVAERCFAAHGYGTWRVPSPWRLGAPDIALATPLIEGWAQVAAEAGIDSPGEVAAWARRRLAAVREGSVEVVVGHQDVLALPPMAPQ